MSEAEPFPQPSVLDPGARWRKIARRGAFVAIASTIVPIDGDILWTISGELLDIARSQRGEEGPIGSLITAFCLMIVPVLTSGIAVAIAASARSLDPADRQLPIGGMWLLFFATVLMPAYFFGFHMQGVARDDTAAIVGIGILILFLFFGGLTFLMYWDQRKTPLAIFGLGIMPISLNLLAWAALAVAFAAGGPGGVLWVIFVCAGVTGAAMMFIGWLCWWRAVKKEMLASRGSARPANQPSSSSS
jgi:hypothetical protein